MRENNLQAIEGRVERASSGCWYVSPTDFQAMASELRRLWSKTCSHCNGEGRRWLALEGVIVCSYCNGTGKTKE